MLIDDLINPPARYCDMCADTIKSLRACSKYPWLCDECHREYCECQVDFPVDLMSLEEVAQLSEEARVEPLMSRRRILRGLR